MTYLFSGYFLLIHSLPCSSMVTSILPLSSSPHPSSTHSILHPLHPSSFITSSSTPLSLSPPAYPSYPSSLTPLPPISFITLSFVSWLLCWLGLVAPHWDRGEDRGETLQAIRHAPPLARLHGWGVGGTAGRDQKEDLLGRMTWNCIICLNSLSSMPCLYPLSVVSALNFIVCRPLFL